MSLFIEPTSNFNFEVRLSGSDPFVYETGDGHSWPSRSTVTKSLNRYPHYNDFKTEWHENLASENLGYHWVAPSDHHIQVNLARNVTDFQHDVTISFQGPQKIKAVTFEYSVGGQIADKK